MEMFRTAFAIALGAAFLGTGCDRMRAPAEEEEKGEEAAAPEVPKGPHGGKLMGESSGFQVEVTIYETGVPPHFRLYLYEKKKPLSPSAANVKVRITRHGNRTEDFTFKPEADYLFDPKVVEEPHSFDVAVEAKRDGKAHQWTYSQREGRVALDEASLESSGVTLETVGPQALQFSLKLPGEIALNADRIAEVVPRVEGVVAEVKKNLGERVRRGETLVVVESRELADARREFLGAHQRQEFARASFEREKGLFEKKIASESDYLDEKRAFDEAGVNLRAAQQKLSALGVTGAALESLRRDPDQNLTRFEIRAPIDGSITEKDVVIGQAVKGDAHLFTIADLSSVWVDVTVHAKDLASVRVGQTAIVRSSVLGHEAEGKVIHFGAVVGEQTRTALARVAIPNPDTRWTPGLFVDVELVQEEAKVPIAVRAEALQTFRDWDVVFVRHGNEFEARPLELGRRSGEWVEVLSGLSGGESYASKNSFILKADVGKSGASHDH